MKTQIPSRFVAAMLAIFLGCFGFHLLYLRDTRGGVIWLLVSILLSWTVVVPMVLWFVGFCQGVTYLFWDEKSWVQRFED